MNNSQFDISFEKLSYCVGGCVIGDRKYKKTILNEISGEFRACELSGIVGQSGSGKTSLLNILSGFTKGSVSGSIKINGKDSKNGKFREISKYIMQDFSLHRFITVEESMKFAANLTRCNESEDFKNLKITSILKELSLADKHDHYTSNLSGGEQKRLSIALELIDDPSILYLDEPTTGLDSLSSLQCVQLLRKLAYKGKTIICTIHTPSALLFEMFDYIYALADGNCIYQGSSKNLVPFLKELDLICPPSYNPIDFLLEISNNDYGEQNQRLTDKIENGMNSNYRSRDLHTSKKYEVFNIYLDSLNPDPNPISTRLMSNFTNQLGQLLMRNFLIATRDKTLTLMRLTIHLTIAIFIGIMYNGIGDDASNIFNIYKFLFFNIFLLMFTAFSSLQTSFPLELAITRREHFNGWYSTNAYYLALSIIDIPIIISTNIIYIVITYFMTNQPMELTRICAYYLIILLLSFAAQGLGLIAGSILNVKFTLILGSFFLCPFVLFSNFFVQMKDTHEMWHWIFQLSFIKHALDGSLQAIFGFNRDKMDCNDTYCHYRWPHKFLESLEVTDNFTNIIIKLTAFALVFRVIAFYIMWLRLRH